jgi:hexosaminidase
VVTPQAQFARDSLIRDIPVNDLPPVFPTPVQVTRGTGALRLSALPPIAAPPNLAREARFAAEYLQPYVSEGNTSAAFRLEVGPVEGQSSPEAYELVIDPRTGVRIVGNSPAGVFYGLQSLRTLLTPPSKQVQGWSCPRCAWWTRPDSATAGSCSTSRATSIRRPRCCAPSI